MSGIENDLVEKFGRKEMGIAFAIQFIMISTLYFLVPLYSLDIRRIGSALFTFALLTLTGAVSILAIMFSGLAMFPDEKGGKRPEIPVAMRRWPMAVVAFLFPWMFTFGIPFFVIYGMAWNTGAPFDSSVLVFCIYPMVYYPILWFILAKLFFTPFLIMDGNSIEKSLQKSLAMTSGLTAELGIITGGMTLFAYLFLFIAIGIDDPFYDVSEGTFVVFSILFYSLLIISTYAVMAQLYYRKKYRLESKRSEEAYMAFAAAPAVITVGFRQDEMEKIRMKGVPAFSLAKWALRAPLHDISQRPAVYEGDSTWCSKKLVIFSGVPPNDMSMLIDRIRAVVGREVLFLSLTPLNSGYTLETFIEKVAGAPVERSE